MVQNLHQETCCIEENVTTTDQRFTLTQMRSNGQTRRISYCRPGSQEELGCARSAVHLIEGRTMIIIE
jgi:hypothetical protein